jgi:hypothetical protein
VVAVSAALFRSPCLPRSETAVMGTFCMSLETCVGDGDGGGDGDGDGGDGDGAL